MCHRTLWCSEVSSASVPQGVGPEPGSPSLPPWQVLFSLWRHSCGAASFCSFTRLDLYRWGRSLFRFSLRMGCPGYAFHLLYFVCSVRHFVCTFVCPSCMSLWWLTFCIIATVSHSSRAGLQPDTDSAAMPFRLLLLLVLFLSLILIVLLMIFGQHAEFGQIGHPFMIWQCPPLTEIHPQLII